MAKTTSDSILGVIRKFELMLTRRAVNMLGGGLRSPSAFLVRLSDHSSLWCAELWAVLTAFGFIRRVCAVRKQIASQCRRDARQTHGALKLAVLALAYSCTPCRRHASTLHYWTNSSPTIFYALVWWKKSRSFADFCTKDDYSYTDKEKKILFIIVL